MVKGGNVMAAPAERFTADYDPIAWFYNQHWSAHYHPWALEMLERALLYRIPNGAQILDVCCGNGVLASEFAARGYQVTGVDASPEMLRYARVNAPSAEFLLADARSFSAPRRFDAAVSTFDSLNYMLSEADLLAVFRNVFAALLDGGRFVFDLNLEERYRDFWEATCATVDDEHACFIRGDYDRDTHIGRTVVTLFRPSDGWDRKDVVFIQRCHPVEDVLSLLRRAGFAEAACVDAVDDLGVQGEFGIARGIFIATKAAADDGRRHGHGDGVLP
jgi:SAM-dependent methyltransferase